MKAVKKYVADDGTEFDDRKACMTYEKVAMRRIQLINHLGKKIDKDTFDPKETSTFYSLFAVSSKPDVVKIIDTIIDDADRVGSILLGKKPTKKRAVKKATKKSVTSGVKEKTSS